jgi:hypothetical protein
LTVHYPAGWHLTPFDAEAATVVFPLIHLSTEPLSGACGSDQPSVQIKAECFNAKWPVPSTGLIIEWTKTEFPSMSPFKTSAGRRMRIDGHRAKIITTLVGNGGREITASILAGPKPGSPVLLMTAQIGRHASRTVVDDVYEMLGSSVITD